MSVLARFSAGLDKFKARIFEQGSLRMECQLCRNKRFGLLFRFSDPRSADRGICHECLVRLSLQMPIEVDGKQYVFGPKDPPKKRKRKKVVKKVTKAVKPKVDFQKPGQTADLVVLDECSLTTE